MKRVLFILIVLNVLTVSAQNQFKTDSISILENKIIEQIQEFNDSLGLLNKKWEVQTEQIKDLNRQIAITYQKFQASEVKIGNLNNEIQALKKEANFSKKSIDNLQITSKTNSNNIKSIADDLGTKIKENQTATTANLVKMDESLNKNKLYWIIATIATLLLGGFIYWFLNKRISSSKTNVEKQIQTTKVKVEEQIFNTRKSLEEESIKLDNKLVEVLETQFKISQAEQVIQSNNENKIDHSFALKVAHEITRMEKNVVRLKDKGTKGLTPLTKGIERLINNLKANNYEVINLLNTEYDERMTIDVINFLDDERIEKDKRIITKVMRPQVNYKGILIQRAQVDVSQN